jgi:mycothiol synthase
MEQIQLRMLFDGRTQKVPAHPVAEGFRIRVVRRNDWPAYYRLRLDGGFDLWNDEKMKDFQQKHLIPGGLLVVEEISTGRLVASAAAEHGELPDAAIPGTLGWVMTHPDYRGRGFCSAVSCAATQKLIDAGLKELYLLTDDSRLAAASVYLKLDWRPWLFQPDMRARWGKICATLGYPPDWLERHAATARRSRRTARSRRA